MTAEELIDDPGFLAYKFNFETESVEFLPVDRDELRKVASLKRGNFDSDKTLHAVPLAEIAALLESRATDPRGDAPRFIFVHRLFCRAAWTSTVSASACASRRLSSTPQTRSDFNGVRVRRI